MAFHDMDNASSLYIDNNQRVTIATAYGKERDGREIALYLQFPVGEDSITLTERQARMLSSIIGMHLEDRERKARREKERKEQK